MNFPTLDHTIYLTLAGSHAYGMSRPESDVDVRGICIPPRAYFLGCYSQFEQRIGNLWDIADEEHCDFVHANYMFTGLDEVLGRQVGGEEEIDTVVYDLRKFLNLAAKCNPNIIELLFSPDDICILTSRFFDMLQEKRDLFLSTKAKHTFSGYAHAQLKRIRGHRNWLLNPPTHQPTREEFGLPTTSAGNNSKINVAKALVKARMDEWEIDYGTMDDAGKIYIQEQIERFLLDCKVYGPEEKYLIATQAAGYSEEFGHFLQQERKYDEAKKNWKQYQNWRKNRNPARAVLEEKSGYDTKHASHLVRLMNMAREIFTEGKVIVRRPDTELLKEIRDGAWDYDRLMEFMDGTDRELTALYEEDKAARVVEAGGQWNKKKWPNPPERKSPLPSKPDMTAIESLCLEIHEEYFRDPRMII